MIVSVTCLLITIVIIGVVAGVTVYFTTHKEQVSALKEKLPDLPIFKLSDLFQWDPFNGKKDASSWPNNGTGLQLTILNALESDWNIYFYKAVQQWDDGKPDALALSTELLSSPDFNCTNEKGYMKVCNGNYGETGWTGVNQLLMTGKKGFITSSSARMNEYYLMNSSNPVYASKIEAARQYTMCHEIGHGFGLPHTDEDFYNKDQGNCLDITVNPQNNSQPDRENFKLLKRLYGKVNPNDDPFTETSTTSNQKVVVPSNSHGGRFTRRQRRRDNVESSIDEYSTNNNNNIAYPDWVIEAIEDINTNFVHASIHERRRRQLSSSNNPNHHQYRLLESTPYSEHHEFAIGNDYYLQIQFLMAAVHQ